MINIDLIKSALLNGSKTMTPGHIQNIPFDTSLNSELRAPKEELFQGATKVLSALDYIASQTMGIRSGIGQYYIKRPLEENTEEVKDRLNKEFEALPPTRKTQTYYRGITDISDKSYQEFSNLKPGDKISPDKGFAYISENCEDAKLYCKEGKNRTLFEIVVPKGSKISRTGKFGFSMSKRAMSTLKSAEAMLPAGAKFEVLAKENLEGLLKLTLKFLK